jgi:hypothetical protein
MDDELAKLPYVCYPTGTSVPHFRAIIPENLRPYADGRKVFKRTLGKDRLKQRERYARLLSEYQTLLSDARAAAAEDPLHSTRPVGPVRLLKALPLPHHGRRARSNGMTNRCLTLKRKNSTTMNEA